jgi:hypothetical protein
MAHNSWYFYSILRFCNQIVEIIQEKKNRVLVPFADTGNLTKAWFPAPWGSSCDIGFNANDFLEKHPQFEWQKYYLVDMVAEPWTVFPVREEVIFI